MTFHSHKTFCCNFFDINIIIFIYHTIITMITDFSCRTSPVNLVNYTELIRVILIMSAVHFICSSYEKKSVLVV
jgi:hypothetical protein